VTAVLPEIVPPKEICFAFSRAFTAGPPNLRVVVVVPVPTDTCRETRVD
jgi:hypothetical protein